MNHAAINQRESSFIPEAFQQDWNFLGTTHSGVTPGGKPYQYELVVHGSELEDISLRTAMKAFWSGWLFQHNPPPLEVKVLWRGDSLNKLKKSIWSYQQLLKQSATKALVYPTVELEKSQGDRAILNIKLHKNSEWKPFIQPSGTQGLFARLFDTRFFKAALGQQK